MYTLPATPGGSSQSGILEASDEEREAETCLPSWGASTQGCLKDGRQPRVRPVPTRWRHYFWIPRIPTVDSASDPPLRLGWAVVAGVGLGFLGTLPLSSLEVPAASEVGIWELVELSPLSLLRRPVS